MDKYTLYTVTVLMTLTCVTNSVADSYKCFKCTYTHHGDSKKGEASCKSGRYMKEEFIEICHHQEALFSINGTTDVSSARIAPAQDDPHLYHTICGKMVFDGKVSSKNYNVVKRDCFRVHDEAMMDGCAEHPVEKWREMVGHGNLLALLVSEHYNNLAVSESTKIAICFCKGDKCNGGIASAPISLNILIASLLICLKAILL